MAQSGIESLEDRILLSFSTPVNYGTGPGASGPVDLVTADFNNDQRLDIATANNGHRTVSVMLGDGQGGFGAATLYDVGNTPYSIAVGDFNEDGTLDLAVARRDGVSILRGHGNGTFVAAEAVETIANPTSVAVGDFNGDGKLDLGVTSYSYYSFADDYIYSGYVSVHAGDGAGNFDDPKSTSAYPTYFNSAFAADLDRDGIDDLLVGDPIAGLPVHVLLGDASGFLQPTATLNAGFGVDDVAAGDLNGDNIPDIVAANRYNGGVSVLLGNGQGGYSAPQMHATGRWAESVVLGDFTGDGKVDIAFLEQITSQNNTLNVLRGNGDGTFSATTPTTVAVDAIEITAGDFDNDGWLDVATVNYSQSVSVLTNDQKWGASSPKISVSDAKVTEGNAGTINATFTVTLSHASNANVTVNYSTANITATAGSDYTTISGKVTIPAGQLSRTFTVAVKGDRLAEPTETFAVNLSAPTNATIGDGQGIGTIVDNEPRISISDMTKAEGRRSTSTSFAFTVTLSAPYDQAVTLSFRTVDGTARMSDADYKAKSGTLTFAPGETTKTITITVNGDSKRESNEEFYLDLFGLSSNARFTKFRGIGNILNDD